MTLTTSLLFKQPNITSVAVRQQMYSFNFNFRFIKIVISSQNCWTSKQFLKKCCSVSTSPQWSQNGSSIIFLMQRYLLVGKYLCSIRYCKLCNFVEAVTLNASWYISGHLFSNLKPSSFQRCCATGISSEQISLFLHVCETNGTHH